MSLACLSLPWRQAVPNPGSAVPAGATLWLGALRRALPTLPRQASPIEVFIHASLHS